MKVKSESIPKYSVARPFPPLAVPPTPAVAVNVPRRAPGAPLRRGRAPCFTGSLTLATYAHSLNRSYRSPLFAPRRIIAPCLLCPRLRSAELRALFAHYALQNSASCSALQTSARYSRTTLCRTPLRLCPTLTLRAMPAPRP